jgi:hypothetical protein
MEDSIDDWKALLKTRKVTENMMRWMGTFVEPCHHDCCFASDCAVISCSSCFKKLTSLSHPLERYQCKDCIETSQAGGELCGPTYCADCFHNGEVLHFHSMFCRIEDTTGQHSFVKRDIGVSEQRALEMEDFISWVSAEGEVASSCCICCSDFEPTGEAIASRRVCPPGCNGSHDDSRFNFNKGWIPIPGAAYCGDCAMERWVSCL